MKISYEELEKYFIETLNEYEVEILDYTYPEGSALKKIDETAYRFVLSCFIDSYCKDYGLTEIVIDGVCFYSNEH